MVLCHARVASHYLREKGKEVHVSVVALPCVREITGQCTMGGHSAAPVEGPSDTWTASGWCIVAPVQGQAVNAQ